MPGKTHLLPTCKPGRSAKYPDQLLIGITHQPRWTIPAKLRSFPDNLQSGYSYLGCCLSGSFASFQKIWFWIRFRRQLRKAQTIFLVLNGFKSSMKKLHLLQTKILIGAWSLGIWRSQKAQKNPYVWTFQMKIAMTTTWLDFRKLLEGELEEVGCSAMLRGAVRASR